MGDELTDSVGGVGDIARCGKQRSYGSSPPFATPTGPEPMTAVIDSLSEGLPTTLPEPSGRMAATRRLPVGLVSGQTRSTSSAGSSPCGCPPVMGVAHLPFAFPPVTVPACGSRGVLPALSSNACPASSTGPCGWRGWSWPGVIGVDGRSNRGIGKRHRRPLQADWVRGPSTRRGIWRCSRA